MPTQQTLPPLKKKKNPGNGRNAQQVQNVTCCRPDNLVQSQNTHGGSGKKKKTFTPINPTVKRQTRKLFPSDHTKFKYDRLPNICYDWPLLIIHLYHKNLPCFPYGEGYLGVCFLVFCLFFLEGGILGVGWGSLLLLF